MCLINVFRLDIVFIDEKFILEETLVNKSCAFLTLTYEENFETMRVAQKLNFEACDEDDHNINSSGCGDDISDSSIDDLYISPLSNPSKLAINNLMDCSDYETIQSYSRNNHFPATTSMTASSEIRIPLRESGSPKKMAMACSPPYKRVRALRLFDSPATPRTLIEKSVFHTPVPYKCSRLFSIDKPRPKPVGFPVKTDKPAANVNPFTPNGMLLNAKKRTRSKRNLLETSDIEVPKFELDSEDSESEMEQPTKRVALQDSNIPRYRQEFLELGIIGTGEFGSVYKCINRLDGCTYAVKKSLKPVAGNINEKNALNEVYAHAVLGKHENVVRYYSAWAEDNHMIIQNEYCNGGSLADEIIKQEKEKRFFTELEIRQLLLHVAKGLRYIHSMHLVHMDIKPGNIFISREKKLGAMNDDSADDGFDEEETVEEEITYKIGDFGHVTSINNPQVEEGDCRYLPTEILHEDFTHLTKADIFALGLTVYEAAGGGALPKNGPEWHKIRNGELKELPRYSKDLNDLLKLMIHPNAEMRPSASCLIQNKLLSAKTKVQLRREPDGEKHKDDGGKNAPNDIEMNGATSKNFCGYQLRPTPTRLSSRVIGKKVNRSHSTIF